MLRSVVVGVLLVIGAGVLLCACGGERRQSAGCVGTLRWNATTYREYAVDRQSAPQHGIALGEATVPPCSDEEPPSGDQSPDPVQIVALRGVSSQIAVARADRPDTAYLAEGFLPELRTHPLHETTRIGELRPARCRSPIAVDGRIAKPTTTTGHIQIERADGRRESIWFRGDGRIRGFRRAGEPYLQSGDLVSIRGRYCRALGPGPDPVVLAVSSLRPALGFQPARDR